MKQLKICQSSCPCRIVSGPFYENTENDTSQHSDDDNSSISHRCSSDDELSYYCDSDDSEYNESLSSLSCTDYTDSESDDDDFDDILIGERYDRRNG